MKNPNRFVLGLSVASWGLVLIVVLLFVHCRPAAARDCYNPGCLMCNRNYGPMSGYDMSGRWLGLQQFNTDKFQPAPVPARPSPPSRPVLAATPLPIVNAMLLSLELHSADILYDLGCGDGRVLIAAVRDYGCQAVGIEIDPYRAALARDRVSRSGVGRIRVVTGDATRFYLDQATAVFMYQDAELMRQLVPRLRTDRIVSYLHEIPGKSNRELKVRGKKVYVSKTGEAGTKWGAILSE